LISDDPTSQFVVTGMTTHLAEPISVAVVEDEPLFLDLLSAALQHSEATELVGAFRCGEEARRFIPRIDPQVVVLDIDLGTGLTGIQLGMLLRELRPSLGVVLLSNHWLPNFLGTLSPDCMAGWSYLLKRSVADVDTVVRAIQGAASGLMVLDPYIVARRKPRAGGALARLSSRQRVLLNLIAQGFTNTAIAERLRVAPSTVENQLSQIYQTLDPGMDGTEFNPRVRAALLFVLDSQTTTNPTETRPMLA
jgi:DNA-binding NarL/FixJ family response regulator